MVGRVIFLLIVSSTFIACGGGGDDSAGNPNPQQSVALTEEVNNTFPFSASDPLKVFFSCQRRGSSLAFDFDFKGDGTFDVRFVDTTPADILLPGTYQYTNSTITIDPINTLTSFPEKSRDIETFMGMIVAFETFIDDPLANPNQIEMQCVAVGHRYGDPGLESWRHYGTCDAQTFNTLTYDNAFEFTAHSSVHTTFEVPGGVFRHREWLGQQNILQGWGIYRRVGNTYYAYFGNQFDDENLFKGEFSNGDQQISVPQISINCSQ